MSRRLVITVTFIVDVEDDCKLDNYDLELVVESHINQDSYLTLSNVHLNTDPGWLVAIAYINPTGKMVIVDEDRSDV